MVDILDLRGQRIRTQFFWTNFFWTKLDFPPEKNGDYVVQGELKDSQITFLAFSVVWKRRLKLKQSERKVLVLKQQGTLWRSGRSSAHSALSAGRESRERKPAAAVPAKPIATNFNVLLKFCLIYK